MKDKQRAVAATATAATAAAGLRVKQSGLMLHQGQAGFHTNRKWPKIPTQKKRKKRRGLITDVQNQSVAFADSLLATSSATFVRTFLHKSTDAKFLAEHAHELWQS